MQVITIGSDRAVFQEGSPSRKRLQAYARTLGGLQVVVFSLRSQGLKPVKDGELSLYPTNSFSKWLYVADAVRIGKRLSGEVVSAQDPFESGLAARGVARALRIPLHLQVHTDITSPYFKKTFLNRIRLGLARFVLPATSRIRVVSERIKKGLIEKYQLEAPISVLPIFVDLAHFASLSNTQHPRFERALLWVGRLEKEKDPAFAIHALAEMRKKGIPAGLTVLGEGSLLPSLRKLVGALHLEEWVEFVGWQDPAAYYSAADLLLCTSEYEGYGMVIVEALAAGVPVLSLDVGVAKEVGAFVVSKENFIPTLEKILREEKGRANLQNYPYRDFEEYASKYCEDIHDAVI